MLHAQQCAEDIGIKGGSVAFGGLLRYRAGLAFGTSGIDGHIQATKPPDCLIYQAAHIVFVAHIGPHKFSFRAEFAKLPFSEAEFQAKKTVLVMPDAKSAIVTELSAALTK